MSEKEKVDVLSEEFDNTAKEEKKDKKVNKLEELKAQVSELNNKYLSALAESKNYKKRCDDEMEKFYKYSTFSLCKELIKTLDSFELAMKNAKDDESTKAFLEGFKMIESSLLQTLEKEGVTKILSDGKEFDPNFMVGISQVSLEGKEDQEVVQTFLTGYMYKDRVLRPASVIINIKEEKQGE